MCSCCVADTFLVCGVFCWLHVDCVVVGRCICFGVSVFVVGTVLCVFVCMIVLS